MEIFDFDDYKEFVLKLLKSGPKRGRGELKRMAEYLKVNSVVMSQVFKGNRDLNLEQSWALSEYFGFSNFERKYFVTLVLLARSGSSGLREYFKAQLLEIKNMSREIKSRVKVDKALDENAKATFYSNWFYSGISLITAIEGYQSTEAIASYLELPRSIVKRVMDFLVEAGINIQDASGFRPGPRITHLESESPLVSRHHTNWRIKGFNKMTDLNSENLFYTGPMVLSKDLQSEIRKKIVALIESNLKMIQGCPDEVLCCLNIDWYKL